MELFRANTSIHTNPAFISTLANSVSAGATSFTVATGAGALLPSPTGGDYFRLRIGTNATNEVVRITARSGDVCTCDALAANHTAGDDVIWTVSGETLEGLKVLDQAWAQTFITAIAMQLAAYREAVGSHTLSSGTLTFDCATGNYFAVPLTGNVTTVAFSNVPSSIPFPLTIKLTQDATGGRTVAGWPSAKWPGGVAPIITAAANSVDIISGMFDDGSVLRLARAHANSK